WRRGWEPGALGLREGGWGFGLLGLREEGCGVWTPGSEGEGGQGPGLRAAVQKSRPHFSGSPVWLTPALRLPPCASLVNILVGAEWPWAASVRDDTGVCCLVLVALSLWPDRAAAPGPPPGPPRASPDPRAELDSAVLLTRSLLADTRQLAAQLVGETGGDGLGPGPGVGRASGLPRWQKRGGGRSLGPVWRMEGPLELGRVPLKASLPPQRDKFPADGDHNLDSLPTLAMSAGALGALQLPGVLTRLRADLFSYLRHVQWLRRAGGPSLRTLEPELGALQARLDRLLRRLQLLMSRLALPQAPPDPPAPPLAPPASAWGGIRAAHAILGGLHLTLDWAVRGLLLLKTRL
uniref:Interleukin-11 n=6 Tax=Laurasiatheria TaxID=314145 RepID=A0A7N5JSS3_AILME